MNIFGIIETVIRLRIHFKLQSRWFTLSRMYQ